MKFHLAIVIGETGYFREDLFVANNIKEFDSFTSQFNNSEEIRLKYQDIIQEFLLDYRHEVKKRETKYGKQRGRIAAYYIVDNQIEFIKVAYKNNPVIRRYDELDSISKQFDFIKLQFEKINERAMINNGRIGILEKIKTIIIKLNRIGYSLSDDELYSLRLYYESNNAKYLNDFFIKIKCQLKKREKLKLKTNADESFSLDEDTNIEQDFIINKRDKIVSDCKDELFMQLYQSGDHERLHELYDIEEIDRYIKR